MCILNNWRNYAGIRVGNTPAEWRIDWQTDGLTDGRTLRQSNCNLLQMIPLTATGKSSWLFEGQLPLLLRSVREIWLGDLTSWFVFVLPCGNLIAFGLLPWPTAAVQTVLMTSLKLRSSFKQVANKLSLNCKPNQMPSDMQAQRLLECRLPGHMPAQRWIPSPARY